MKLFRRKTKLPSKRLLKMFVKYSAEQLTVEGKDVWIVKVLRRFNTEIPRNLRKWCINCACTEMPRA
jgi:hypothetical protein